VLVSLLVCEDLWIYYQQCSPSSAAFSSQGCRFAASPLALRMRSQGKAVRSEAPAAPSRCRADQPPSPHVLKQFQQWREAGAGCRQSGAGDSTTPGALDPGRTPVGPGLEPGGTPAGPPEHQAPVLSLSHSPERGPRGFCWCSAGVAKCFVERLPECA